MRFLKILYMGVAKPYPARQKTGGGTRMGLKAMLMIRVPTRPAIYSLTFRSILIAKYVRKRKPKEGLEDA
eukprot:6828024-Prorocentrum_lima.AAC.1